MITALIGHKRYGFFLAACFASLLASPTASAEGLLLSPDEYLAIKDQCFLVDVRDAQTFLTERLPDSIWLDAAQFSSADSLSSGKLPPANDLLTMLSDRGFKPDMHIVLYGSNTSAGDITAVTRVFWALEFLGYTNVSILDGGISRWKAEEKPLVSEAPTSALPPTAIQESTGISKRRMNLTEVKQALEDNTIVLLDTRPVNQYDGSVQIRDMSRAGHIPGAYNIPYFLVVNMPHALFNSPEALKSLLYSDAITPESFIVTYCNTGTTATVLYFAYRLIGHENITLYDGGMFEWSANASLPVSTDAPE
jgi:thiosulfate/3-mercaptopyruvate sulfurtransferase